MVDNTITTAAEMANQPKQNCPLMKLPVELRLKIYKFAFEDIVYDIMAEAATKKQFYQEADALWPAVSVDKADHPNFVGVLGVLHVSRELRCECLDALQIPTRAFRDVCFDHYKATKKAFDIPVRDQHGRFRQVDDFLRLRRLLHLEHNEALHKLQWIELIQSPITLVVRGAKLI
jgi:hypothetical protein